MRRVCLFITFWLFGCATPAARFVEHAEENGFERREVRGLGFQHVVFARRAVEPQNELHLYLDGDGTPWLGPGQIAEDPSTRSRLILELMDRDPAQSILVGRPCYYRRTPDPQCAESLWTSHRYSEAVVASMASVIETLLATHPGERVSLIGYSGGGALAILIAPRMSRLNTVITVGANLDIAAWTTRHAYSPLAGSLNPSAQLSLPPRIRQRHFYGELDDAVPAATASRFFAAHPGTQPEIVRGFDHHCCWAERWPAILDGDTLFEQFE